MEKPKFSFCFDKPWSNNDHSIWLASSLCLRRNIDRFSFPAKLEHSKHQQILSLLSNELISLLDKQTPQLFKAEDLSPIQKEFLFEHFLTPLSFQHAHSGEGFVINSTGQFLGILNVEDHLQLLITNTSSELEKSWNYLASIDEELSKRINFAFSEKFGFLTANPAHSGTGLSVSTYIQIPALIHTKKIDEFLTQHIDETIEITGLQGNPKDLIGDLLVIRNHQSLGITEENILNNIRSFSTKLLVLEKATRSHLIEKPTDDLKDKVSRAFGIMAHSYQIEPVEMMNAISLLKLGVSLNWISTLSIQKLNHLFFNYRRAHLMCQQGDKVRSEEIPHSRAQQIHDEIKQAALLI